MRDPTRIDRILSLISEIWKNNSDLRLCQLIENCLLSHCIYYKEDDALEHSLKNFYLKQKINFPVEKETNINGIDSNEYDPFPDPAPYIHD